MNKYLQKGQEKVKHIAKSKLTIYDPIDVGDKKLWLTSAELEAVLNHTLSTKSLHGLPLRTRSKTVKIEICKALGYPIPKSFKKNSTTVYRTKF